MGENVLPSPELLRQLLRYEPETGRLYWKERPREMFERESIWKMWNARFAGQEALASLHCLGYLHGGIHGRQYKAHRVAWAVHHGSWPERQIDHVNGDQADNRMRNLREASSSENSRNRRRRKDNTSGYKGVYFKKTLGRWASSIKTDTRRKHLGYFDTPELAYEAYVQAAKKYHGEFMNYG